MINGVYGKLLSCPSIKLLVICLRLRFGDMDDAILVMSR